MDKIQNRKPKLLIKYSKKDLCRKIKCWRREAEMCVSSWFFLSCDFALSGVLVTEIMKKKGKADETDRNSINLETGVMGALWAMGHTRSQRGANPGKHSPDSVYDPLMPCVCA